jgi:glyoxylase-like metal-dependent hydrolase (beta-lactamase superfamily II)
MAGGPVFSVGSMECWPIADGQVAYDREDLFAGLDDGVLERAGLGSSVQVPYTALLVRTGTSLVLIDAGLGSELAAEWQVPAGRTVQSLTEADVESDAIDVVVISHGHADHVGGLTVVSDGDHVPTFPRARHIVSRQEWQFWSGSAGLDYDREGALIVRSRLGAVRDAGLLDLVEPVHEVAPGLRLVPAPGHTPGHSAVEIRSDGEMAVYIGDAFVHELQTEHPEWISAYDHNPEHTVRTRRDLIAAAVADGRRWIAFHFGATGHVRVGGDRHTFVPDHAGT